MAESHSSLKRQRIVRIRSWDIVYMGMVFPQTSKDQAEDQSTNMVTGTAVMDDVSEQELEGGLAG